jgi:flagellar biosynthesis/type III secretory pathway M-ring protein FliF/YscJ
VLKGNLSTRPFYNERLVSLVVGGAMLLAIALLVFNVTSLYRLSGQRGQQNAEQEVSRAETARVNAEADRLRQSLDRSNLLVLAKDTREANDLIDSRTFSWTEFFTLV